MQEDAGAALEDMPARMPDEVILKTAIQQTKTNHPAHPG